MAKIDRRGFFGVFAVLAVGFAEQCAWRSIQPVGDPQPLLTPTPTPPLVEYWLEVRHFGLAVHSLVVRSAGKSMTVLELMERAQEDHGISFGTDPQRNRSFGYFIDTIGGVTDDENAANFWYLYMNGVYMLHPNNASTTLVWPGDTVVWELR